MIRAVFRKGTIQPLDAVPADWREGDELIVDALPGSESSESLDQWAAEVRAATDKISDEDHDQLMAALAEVEAESKRLGRRELERSP